MVANKMGSSSSDDMFDVSAELNTFFRRADELFRSGDRQAVDDYLLECVQRYDPENIPKAADAKMVIDRDVMYASVLNEAAGWYRNASDFDRSERYFKRALALLEKDGLEATAHYARILLNLAGLYRHMRGYVSAEAAFGKAWAILESTPETDHYAIASVMNNLALVYQDEGDFVRSLDMAEQAAAYIQNCDDADEHEVATELVNIASIQAACDDLDKADASATKALELFEAMEKEDVHHSAALNMLATIRYRQGDYRAALPLYEEALAATERYFGHNIEYATCEENIARTADAMGDAKMAYAHAEAAYDTLESILVSDDPRSIEYREYRDLLGGMV